MTAPSESKVAVRAELPGVRQLEQQRGDQQVSFQNVADHLVDFVTRHPEHRAVVDELGAYLAAVESVDHDHDALAGSDGG